MVAVSDTPTCNATATHGRVTSHSVLPVCDVRARAELWGGSARADASVGGVVCGQIVCGHTSGERL